jgi:seryl-tRNA synthetase
VNGRLSSQGLSIDLRTIAGSLPVVLSHLRSRRASDEALQAAETIASLTSDRTRLIQERDAHLSDRKEASAVVAKLLRKQQDEADSQTLDELESAKARSGRAADLASHAESQLQELEATMDDLLAGIPNLLDDGVPDGDSDRDNLVVSSWGDASDLPKRLGWPDDFSPLWHDDVAATLGGYQAEEAVKLSGARFVALSGEVAQLERALAMFLMDLHTSEEHGYREVSVPLVVSRSTLEGTSQLPKFQEDLFAITRESHTCNGEDAFLIPTAEVPVTNLHRGAVLEESDLPISYVAHTPCFRAEAGSYGRDTKGLIRTHQFYKVELVKITTPEASDEQHELLTSHAEACLQALELPYRKVRLCSGDIGFAARHCYDLEVWLPGAGEFREISSCSNCGDFQARRMGLRYRPKAAESGSGGGGKVKAKKSKPQLCHTINGSGLAVGRTLVAVLENYQRPDGSVVVPEVLRPYMRGKELLTVPTKTS